MSTFHSLKKSPQFAAVYSKKRRNADKYLVIYIFDSEEAARKDINRIGISVGKKVGNSVVRHRIKRIIREIFRKDGAMFYAGSDIVVVVKAEAKNAGHREFRKSVISLMERHGKVKKTP